MTDITDPIAVGLNRLSIDLDAEHRYVLALICAGMTDAQVAEEIGCSCRTVKNRLSYLLDLFELSETRSRAALVAEVLAGSKNVARSVRLAERAWRESP